MAEFNPIPSPIASLLPNLSVNSTAQPTPAKPPRPITMDAAPNCSSCNPNESSIQIPNTMLITWLANVMSTASSKPIKGEVVKMPFIPALSLPQLADMGGVCGTTFPTSKPATRPVSPNQMNGALH